MTNLFRVSGGGLPAGLQTDMDAVLNKKFSTSTTYPPLTWPSNVNLLGLLPLRTKSGSIATITDGADDVPISDGVFDIDYDANGYSGVTIYKTGKNLFTPSGQIDGRYIRSDGETNATTGWTASDFIPVPSSTELYFIPNTTAGGVAKHCFYDKNKDFISYIDSGEQTFTTPNNAKYMRFSYRSTSANIQLEVGDTATTFEAYTGETFEIPFGRTIYGGYYDSVSGVLVSTKAADGTDLADPVEYQLDPVELSTAYLDNNFWCDTGDSSITYRADIDALITELGG